MVNKSNKSGLVLLGVVAVALVAVLAGLGVWSPFPPPVNPPPPGDQPVATFKTDIRLEEPFTAAKPHIEWMKTTQVGNQPVTAAFQQPVVMWFPWVGKLKLKITYPNGQVAAQEQDVKVEWGSGVTVTFVWQTKQAGTHTLVAELYDGSGTLIDSKTEEVTR